MAVILINKSALVNAENKEGTTPLIYAARAFPTDVSSYLHVMELLLRRGADINHTADFTKDTALHMATMNGRAIGVHYLLERSAKPNPINRNGFTPLHIACNEGNAAMVLSLLEHGADPSIKTKEVGTCIEVAEKKSNNPTVIQLLLSWSNNSKSESTQAFYTLLDDIIATLRDFDNAFNSKQVANFLSSPTLEVSSLGVETTSTVRLAQMIEFENQVKPDPSSDFVLEKLLGEGAYGQVFRGVHKHLGFPVAIKVIPVTEKTKLKLQNEIKIQLLNKHNNIVHCYDIYYTGEKVCIVMELCGLGSVLDLQEKLQRSFTEAEMCAIIENILRGLTHLHSNAIIHRDLKCQNVLINNEGKVKLADFGVSSQLEKDQQAKTVIGTPLFMSPEVLLAQPYDYAADIWSLGVTILQLAGELPYQGLAPVVAIFKIITEPPPTLSDSPQFSNQLRSFVELCLQTESRARPSSEALLQNDFITKASQSSEKVMQNLVGEFSPIKEQ